jgi:filamentous hemagglutinin family protein
MEPNPRRRSAKAIATKAIALFFGSALFGTSARSQLMPDNTLGAESSVVTPLDVLRERIDGGAIRGANLFHSFLEFNVGDGRGVYFANPAGIENILTRVTGSNSSNILGTLGVLGHANLFLMNPNGIYFGPNARLEVSGSFLATTGDRIQLGNNGYFSATDIQGSQLLNVQPDALFANALRNHQAQINNQGNLAVGTGQTLTLFGGTVTNSGSLTASGGTVRVLGDRVSLIDSAQIDVSSPTGGGTVLVGGDYQGRGTIPTATQTFVGSGVTINADATPLTPLIPGGNGGGGRVIICANDTTQFYGTITARGANSTAPSNGGFVEVSGKNHLVFRGLVDTSAANGNFGTLLLDPVNIEIRNGANDGDDNGPLTNAFGNNLAGDNGQVLAADPAPTILYESELEGMAAATNIILQASNNIIVNNLADDNLFFAPGPGGSIEFTAGGNLIVQDTNDIIFAPARDIAISAGGNVTVGTIDTRGFAPTDNGGNITITATGGSITAELLEARSNVGNGGAIALNASGDITVTDSIFSLAVFGNGNGGAITIDSTNGSVSLSRVNARTQNGVAGDINITAAGNILIDDFADAPLISIASGIGTGGNVAIASRSGSIFMPDGISTISVGSNGGSISLSASGNILTGGIQSRGNLGGGEISLLSSSGTIDTTAGSIDSSSFSGNAGDIYLQAAGNLNVGDINAIALRGGNISLTSSGTLSIDDRDIRSVTTGSGVGGDINLTARSLLVTNSADVFNATLADGRSGNINVNVIEDAIFSNDAFLGTVTQGTGTGGDLNLTARSLLATERSILVGIAEDAGQGGNVNVNVSDAILLSNDGGFGTTTTDAGNAGNVAVNTRQLMIRSNQPGLTLATGISTTSDPGSSGNSGNIAINASEFIEIIGNQPGQFTPKASTIPTAFATAQAIRGIPTGITTATTGSGNAGSLTVNTGRLTLRNGAGITSGTVGGSTGSGGRLEVNVAGSVELQGKTGIATATFSPGNAGELLLNAQQVTLRDGAVIGADTLGLGNAANLTVNTDRLSLLSGSRIGAATGDRGSGATVRVNASDSIEISGVSRDDPSVSSGLYTDTIASGDAGNLEISTQQLVVREGGAIAASTTGTGQAGKLNVTASDSIQVLGASSRLFFDSSGSGDAGQLNVSTNRLIVRDGGVVSAATSGTGRGGILDLNASQSVEVSGAGGLFFDSRGAGDARGIRINTGSLLVADGGQVTVSGTGTGLSGDLEITANSIFLNNQGRLRATTASSEGGNTNLQVAGSIILRNNSEITAEAFGAANGGNIFIDAGGFVLAILRENSDIVASAVTGRGGNITATATGIFGFRQFQGIRTPESDFTATSELGIEGTVFVDQADRSLSQLAPKLLNVEDLNRDACAVGDGQIAGGSSFVVTGRGGLPENPGEDPAAIAPGVEWANPIGEGETGGRDRKPEETDENEQPRTIRPARGWIMAPDGTVILTAEVPATTTYNLGVAHPNCHFDFGFWIDSALKKWK